MEQLSDGNMDPDHAATVDMSEHLCASKVCPTEQAEPCDWSARWATEEYWPDESEDDEVSGYCCRSMTWVAGEQRSDVKQEPYEELMDWPWQQVIEQDPLDVTDLEPKREQFGGAESWMIKEEGGVEVDSDEISDYAHALGSGIKSEDCNNVFELPASDSMSLSRGTSNTTTTANYRTEVSASERSGGRNNHREVSQSVLSFRIQVMTGLLPVVQLKRLSAVEIRNATRLSHRRSTTNQESEMLQAERKGIKNTWERRPYCLRQENTNNGENNHFRTHKSNSKVRQVVNKSSNKRVSRSLNSKTQKTHTKNSKIRKIQLAGKNNFLRGKLGKLSVSKCELASRVQEDKCMQISPRITTFKPVRPLKEHTKSNALNYSLNPYVCRVCFKVFFVKDRFIAHVRSHCTIKSFTCDICDKQFRMKEHMRNHITTHFVNRPKPFQCDECHKAFQLKDVLLRHKWTHNNLRCVEWFKCDVCKKAFCHKSSLKSHLNTHSDVKPFACDACPARFRTATLLKAHTLTHQSVRVKPYRCPECPKSFDSSGNCRRHLLLHSGLKPYACHDCAKPFYTKSAMADHIATHQISRPRSFECGQCPKSFTEKRHLRQHYRCHSTAKPFGCRRCDARFKYKKSLESHVSTHERRERLRHACGQCEKVFLHTSNLNRHLLSHNDVGFTCDVCPKKYITLVGLTRHKLSHC